MDNFREMKPSDVLIVGAGIAGLRAGIEASAKGGSVRIICKERWGVANSSILSHGFITRCPEEAKVKMFEQMLWAGGGLNNQHLLRAFLKDITRRVDELRDWGVELMIVDRNPPQFPGLFRIVSEKDKLAGLPLVNNLRKMCLSQGVEFVEEVMIFSLLRDGNSVVGALGKDLRRGEVLLFPAKAVVLATGGGAALFKRHNNTKGTTGDGFILGLEAGANLINMEFIILDVPSPIFSSILEGNWKEDFLNKANAHYFLGGLEINDEGETGVKGLFATGEVTGNLFGAGRLGGTAMADVLIFGARAGSASAKMAMAKSLANPEELAKEEMRKLESKLKGKLPPRETKEEIKRIMWEHCGIYKTEERLKEGLEKLLRIKEVGICKEGNWRELLETINMLELGELVLRASLARQESRGSFWRPDHPLPDNHRFFKNLLIAKKKDEYKLYWKDLEMIQPPSPKDIPISPGCFSYRF